MFSQCAHTDKTSFKEKHYPFLIKLRLPRYVCKTILVYLSIRLSDQHHQQHHEKSTNKIKLDDNRARSAQKHLTSR